VALVVEAQEAQELLVKEPMVADQHAQAVAVVERVLLL
jgi:hypothetical protein